MFITTRSGAGMTFLASDKTSNDSYYGLLFQLLKMKTCECMLDMRMEDMLKQENSLSYIGWKKELDMIWLKESENN